MDTKRSAHFAVTLTQCRTFRKLSRTQLAGKAELSRAVIWKWETGRSLPNLDNLYALADALRLPVELLVDRQGKGLTWLTTYENG